MRVIDASVTLAWLYPDEITPTVEEVFRPAATQAFYVPRLWHLETSNILVVNFKRGKYDEAFLRRYLRNLATLDVFTDELTEEKAWSATTELALRHKLTTYDASYLELAMRLGAPLATLDRDLRRAASAEGVPLLGI